METSGGEKRPAPVDPLLRAIGQQIAAVRRAQGRIQIDVAAAAGMPQSQLSRIEHGKYPLTVTQLDALARALEVAVVVLWQAAIGG